MTKTSDFKPGKRLPSLGVTDANAGIWLRWALPIATGLAIALIILYLI
ncbi:MAG TPA: hypothetical protein VGA50_18315 [Kiloniellales bacterium]